MSEAFLTLSMVTISAVAGIFFGIAAIVRAVYDGKAKLLRARRGDPEYPSCRTALSAIVRRRRLRA